MKSTVINQDGQVACPVCGAVNSFTSKRTAKGKLAAGLVAPKRLKCNGCGTNLKRGGGPARERTPHPNSIAARRARKAGGQTR